MKTTHSENEIELTVQILRELHSQLFQDQNFIVPGEVKQPITGLDRPRGFQEVKAPRFRDNGTRWWQVVSLTHQPPLPPGNTPGTHFCQRLGRPPGPQCDRKDFMSMKNPLTPAGIDPATFRYVAQHLNHCATAVPSSWRDLVQITPTYGKGNFVLSIPRTKTVGFVLI